MSDQLHGETSLEKFFEQLTWERVENRVREALRHPDRAVPLRIRCPAVMDLAKQIIEKIGESAIQRPGEVVSRDEVFSFDQRLVILRILEAIIAEYEEWGGKKGRSLTIKFVEGRFGEFPPPGALRGISLDEPK